MTSRFYSVTVFILTVTLLSLLPPQAAADVPDVIKYQGYLQDDTGSAIDGTVSLSFAIYATPTGGPALWGETHASVAVSEGIFHVDLGSVSPLSDVNFSAPDRWLQTSVSGSALSPRIGFASVPFAYRASVADFALTGGEADDDWVIARNDVYRLEGNVGIGTATPSVGLHIKESGAESAQVLLEKAAGSTLALTAATSSVYLGSNSANDVRIVANNSTMMSVGTDGDVGIGTVNPSSRLSINGDLNADFMKADTNLGEFNAPALGGVYRDNVIYAWAHIRSDGIIFSRFGVDNVVRTSQGRYEVYLERSLSDGAISVTSETLDDVVYAGATVNGALANVYLQLFNSSSGQFQANDRNFFVLITGRP